MEINYNCFVLLERLDLNQIIGVEREGIEAVAAVGPVPVEVVFEPAPFRSSDYNNDIFTKNGYKERVFYRWQDEMEARYGCVYLGESLYHYSVNKDLQVGIVLRGMGYFSKTRRNVSQNEKNARSDSDEYAYYLSASTAGKIIKRFFQTYPTYGLCVDASNNKHNGAMYVYRLDGQYKFICFNPNWGEKFDHFDNFVTNISKHCHGFYVSGRWNSNPDGRCRRYSFDWLRSVMAGRLDPKTHLLVYWWCMKSKKRIYNRLTQPDALFYYPRNNLLVEHGFNKAGEKCMLNEENSDDAICNGCNYRELNPDRYDLFTCRICENVDENLSLMFHV